MNTGYKTRASHALNALAHAHDACDLERRSRPGHLDGHERVKLSRKSMDKAFAPAGAECLTLINVDRAGFTPGSRPADYVPEQTYPAVTAQ